MADKPLDVLEDELIDLNRQLLFLTRDVGNHPASTGALMDLMAMAQMILRHADYELQRILENPETARG